MIRLEKFDGTAYKNLISWIDSEKILMQFAGPAFTFPLTIGQLDISAADKNRISFSVISNETNLSIGHAEIYLSEDSAKLGRTIVGNKDQRGRGLGKQIVNLLLDFTFFKLGRSKAELYVFDWNTVAIKCYEHVGFTTNPDKKYERKVAGETWTAINMVIDKAGWNAAGENRTNI